MLYVVEMVWGVTQLDNVVYVVSAYVIKMYTGDTLSSLGAGIYDNGSLDTVASRWIIT